MPNIADAIKILESAPAADTTDATETTETDTDSGGKSLASGSNGDAGGSEPDAHAAAEAALTGEPAPEPAAEPDEKALRLKKLEATIEKLKTAKAEKSQAERLKAERAKFDREREEYAAQRKALEAQRAELDTLRGKWSRAVEDPSAGFAELGLDPVSAYEKITSAAIKADTPEGKAARDRAQLLADLKKELANEYAPSLKEQQTLKEELADLKRRELQREEWLSTQTRERANNEFLKLVGQDGYEDLADYYESDDLITLGDNLADEFAADGRRFTLKDVVDELNGRHAAFLKRAAERKATRKPASAPSTATQVAKETTPAPGTKNQRPNTLTNDLTATASSAGKRAKTHKERLAEAEKLFASE